jgi:hypothetical protein
MSSIVPNKTLVHELINTKLFSSADVQINSTSQSYIFNTYKSQIDLYIRFLNSKQEVNAFEVEKNFWIDSISTIENLDPEFVIFWKDKFNTTHTKVKDLVKGEVNIEDTILQAYSDCIGNAYRQTENIDSKYIPYDDIDFESATPSNLSYILEDKINFDKKITILQANVKTSSLFNFNIRNLYDGQLQEDSHDGTLTQDYYHIKRIREAKEELLEAVARDVGSLFGILLYLTSYKANNLQKILPVIFTIEVDGKSIDVDITGRIIETEEDKITNDNLM